MSFFTYSVVETALSTLFRAKTARQRVTFKARITHLQKLHIIDRTPGKGRAVEYQLEDVWKWMFALELAEVGIAPTVAAKVIKTYWARALADMFKHAARAHEIKKPDDCVWLPGVTLMSTAWDRRDRFGGVPNIGTIVPSVSADQKEIMDFLEKADQPRLCMVNLSSRLRALNAALAAAQQRPFRAKSRRRNRSKQLVSGQAPDDASVRIMSPRP